MAGTIVFIKDSFPSIEDADKRRISILARTLVAAGLMDYHEKPWYYLPKTYHFISTNIYGATKKLDERIKKIHPDIIFIVGTPMKKQFLKKTTEEDLQKRWGAPVSYLDAYLNGIKEAIQRYNLEQLIDKNLKTEKEYFREKEEKQEEISKANMNSNLDQITSIFLSNESGISAEKTQYGYAKNIGRIKIPDNWTFIPVGNIARTRAIKRQEIWWEILEKIHFKKHRQKLESWKVVGYFCPQKTIDAVNSYLDATFERRCKAQERRKAKKEQLLKEKGISFEKAIKDFLNFKEEDKELEEEILELVCEYSTVESLFPVLPDTHAGELALYELERSVINAIRHAYTDYEEELDELSEKSQNRGRSKESYELYREEYWEIKERANYEAEIWLSEHQKDRESVEDLSGKEEAE